MPIKKECSKIRESKGMSKILYVLIVAICVSTTGCRWSYKALDQMGMVKPPDLTGRWNYALWKDSPKGLLSGAGQQGRGRMDLKHENGVVSGTAVDDFFGSCHVRGYVSTSEFSLKFYDKQEAKKYTVNVNMVYWGEFEGVFYSPGDRVVGTISCKKSSTEDR